MVDEELFKKRIGLLRKGKTLLLRHSCCGDFLVSMNPQQNRIFTKTLRETEYFKENYSNIQLKDNSALSHQEMYINYLLMWDCGDWEMGEWKLGENAPHASPDI